jgi:hypothetical protein
MELIFGGIKVHFLFLADFPVIQQYVESICQNCVFNCFLSKAQLTGILHDG